MQNKKYTYAQSKLIVSAFQDKIDTIKKEIESKIKEISEYQELIKEHSEDEEILKYFETVTKVKKTRDTGWIAKINSVLSQSENALTSREILDEIFELYPNFERDQSNMASLSSALSSNSKEGGIFIKHHEKGSFAKFELKTKEQ